MPPLIVIVGETASGKSALALELAKKFDGELICADSWTVYKDFDIGTAKPSGLERATVPHHLLDVADAHGGFNAVIFQQLAIAAINAIQGRGKVPILVGGTGLYIDSVIYHYEFLAAPPAGMREELNKLTLDELLAQAEEQGLLLQSIDTRNKRRVIRLIENEGKLPSRKPLRENTLILGMSVPRDELLIRIEARVDSMLEAGLEDEVRALVNEYGWDAEPMKGIGYWQWKAYFEGDQSLEETRAKIIKATMDLAKRQRTWFRRYGKPAEPAAGRPFSVISATDSIDVRSGTSQSSATDLPRKSSTQHPAQQTADTARNESIHWISTEDNYAQAVELATTFLHKQNA